MFQSILDSLRCPIWQAPISEFAGPELAAAVSNGGGVGSMALTWTEPEAAAERVRQVRKLTQNPFFVNFALAFPPDALEAALEAGAPIVTFSWGDPGPHMAKVKAAGVSVGVQVTNAQGVKRAIGQGADFLICQGIEAGGHVQSNRSLWDLLPQIVEEAAGVPVIAAGGIAHGSQIARALSLGAKGTILGTRFAATLESRAHPDYKRKLVEATEGATSLTVCFEGGWPYSAHRVLRNSTLEAWEAAGSPPVGSRPGEDEAIAVNEDGDPILRYGSTEPRLGIKGNIEAMCLYAGTGCSAIADTPPASELVERLWRECRDAAG